MNSAGGREGIIAAKRNRITEKVLRNFLRASYYLINFYE